MLHCTPGSGGGTEHINSTIMGARPYIFRDESSYRGFLSLAMHEFFHTWNVKQLRPAGIHPYDFMNENYTEELWVAEGMTDYYTKVLMRRAGFTTVDQTLEGLATGIRDAQSRPGRAVQSLAESSFDAWVKFWKNSPNAFNSEVDYYDKGSDVSLLLDLDIRHRSENRASLDDAMRIMYKRFPLSGTGYTNADLQKIIEELTNSGFAQFFEDYIYGTKEIDFKNYLAYAGLEVIEKTKTDKPEMGIMTAMSGDKTVVRRVSAGSAAHAAGLDRDDEILALNGSRVRHSDLESRLADFKVGDKITLSVFRDDQLRNFEVTLRAPVVPDYKVTRRKEANSLQRKIYSSWLGAEWPEEQAASE
jgi:predicted metalloprotease with PDZ domain